MVKGALENRGNARLVKRRIDLHSRISEGTKFCPKTWYPKSGGASGVLEGVMTGGHGQKEKPWPNKKKKS